MLEFLMEWSVFCIGLCCGFALAVAMFVGVLIDRALKLSRAKLAGLYFQEKCEQLEKEIKNLKGES